MAKSYPLAKRATRAHRPISIMTEALESRTLFSVSLVNGWTTVKPPAGTRIVYCSSSTGSDRNSGLSASAPVATISHAESLLQNHTGEQLLLKAGDTWYTNFGYWTLSGASAQNPMVIGSYGSGARPTIDTGTSSGMVLGKSAATQVSYLDVLGLHFDSSGRDPALTSSPAGGTNVTGINALSGTNITIENCLFQDYTVNVNFQDYYGPVKNVSFRRNVDIDSYSTSSSFHSQGLYATGVSSLLIEGNVFDHDGWNASVSGAGATIYNHDCYLSSDNTSVVVDNNIFSQASATGLQDRPGGIVVNNVFINDAVDMTFGLVNGASTTVGGVSGVVVGNVFIGGANTGSTPQGIGLEIGNIRAHSGTLIANNIFSQGEAGAGPAMVLEAGIAQSNPSGSVGINDLMIVSNTFYSWTIGIDVAGGLTPGGTGLTALNRVSFTNNQFENITKAAVENGSASYLKQETWTGNQYQNSSGTGQGTTRSTPIPFAAPSRSVATYDASIGGTGLLSDFIKRLRLESASSWSASLQAPAVVGYISAGFSQT